jgi:predicted RNA-binding Zn ribbon-like protein
MGMTSEIDGDDELAISRYALASQELDNLVSSSDVPRTRTEQLLEVQATLLQAVYHQLRHNHSQQAGLTQALEAHTLALAEHRAEQVDALDRRADKDTIVSPKRTPMPWHKAR